MKILIIGGTGLISTAITRELLVRGSDEVVLYNRGQTPARYGREVATLHGDRNDAATFEAQMAAAGPFDAVIDMICFTPEQAQSTIRAFAGRTDHLVFCSTVDVYAKPASRYPITEDERRDPPGPHSYGHNKVACEDLFMAAHARGDFKATIMRPAHTYGEGGAIIHTFGWHTRYLDRIRKGKPIIVHGDGTSLWVSCHVDDVAHAFVTALGNPATYGKAYHMTGEEWQPWDVYHQGVARALNAPEPTLVHIPIDVLYQLAPEETFTTRVNFYGNSIFDNSAAKRDLDFKYTIPWEDGVRRTVAWLDEHDRIESSDVENDIEDRILAAWQRMTAQLVAEFE